MNYVIYARKSTEGEGRQIASIDSQIRELQELAIRQNFTITEILTESKSASKLGRPVFESLIERIEKGEIDRILCWKPDRLSRNPIDSGKIQWLLQERKIKQIKTPGRDFNSDDNAIIAGIEFAMACQYSRDLSTNVKRGNKTKLENGGWPRNAFLGYLNDKINKTILVDKQRAKHVRRLFVLYSQGNKSFKEISDILFDEGLRTHGGNKVGKSVLHRMISNSFYYGLMLSNGEYYPGKHVPIISKKMFDTAQAVLHGKNDSRQNKHFYTYRGFMTCAECGCTLTGDKKKGRYVYYYCTNGKGNCNQHKKYLASKQADKIMANVLDLIGFRPELIEIVYQASLEKFANTKTDQSQMENEIEKRLKTTRERRSRLMDMYLDSSVAKSDYEAKSREIQTELLDLENQKNNIAKRIANEQSTFELTKKVFLEASKAKNEFMNAKDDKKINTIENLLSNLVVRDLEMASVSFKMPYEIMKKSPQKDDFFVLSGRRDSNPV